MPHYLIRVHAYYTGAKSKHPSVFVYINSHPAIAMTRMNVVVLTMFLLLAVIEKVFNGLRTK